MFERLMNLDVEVRGLATKAFVAKEELKDKIFYPANKKYDKDTSKKDKTEQENNVEKDNDQVQETRSSRGPVYEYNMRKLREKRESANIEDSNEYESTLLNPSKKPAACVAIPKNNLPAAMVEENYNIMDKYSDFGDVLADLVKTVSPEELKVIGEGISEAVEEMRKMVENQKNVEHDSEDTMEAVEEPPVVVTPIVTTEAEAEPMVHGMDYSKFQEGVAYETPTASPDQPKVVTEEDVEKAIKIAKEKAKGNKK